MKYLLGADFGTTSLKAVVYDERLKPVLLIKREYALLSDNDRVEFPAQKYWEMLSSVIEEAKEKYPVYALSVDTQCETLIVCDKKGEPLCNAIVWLDNRAKAQAEKIEKAFGEKTVYEHTGQVEITATWPASKLLWLKEENPAIFEKAEKFFLLEDYLLYKLTGKFVTQETLQSSSLYYDVVNHRYWKEMLDFIGVFETKFPKVLKSGDLVGEYHGIKVIAGAMDQIAGAIGVGAAQKGVISEMTGTTMAVFAAVDEMPAYRQEQKIPCHLNYNGKYCLLSWSPTAGMALRWFQQTFCPSLSFADIDEMAKKVSPGSDGLTFFPYLCGSTTPRYNPEARGGFYGFTLGHTLAHATRSVLEAVACMLKETLETLGADCEEICSTGGGAKSPLWSQIKADVTKKRVITLKTEETACLGSAILAGVGAGLFPSVEEAVKGAVERDKIYEPSGADYSDCYRLYQERSDKLIRQENC